MIYQLPELPYPVNALEPCYDAETVRIHHDFHHKSYVDGLNNAIKKINEARDYGDFALIKHWEKELAFHGSGYILHNLLWTNMTGLESFPTKAGNTSSGKASESKCLGIVSSLSA